MGVRTTSRNAGPTKGSTPWMDGHLEKFYNTQFDAGDLGTDFISGPQGIDATGGVIGEWAAPTGEVYRTHTWTESGTFVVNKSGKYGNDVQYLVVGAGGGGGGNPGGNSGGGGGGGGSVISSVIGDSSGGPQGAQPTFACPDGTYLVYVGAGGAGGHQDVDGLQGGSSYFGPPSTPTGILARGGGFGTTGPTSSYGGPGGSGGGQGRNPTNRNGGAPAQNNQPGPGVPFGFDGGGNGNHGGGNQGGGGGGGAGAVGGTAGASSTGGAGGNGRVSLIYGPANPMTFAGGGGGAGYATNGTIGDTSRGGIGGTGGGAPGSNDNPGKPWCPAGWDDTLGTGNPGRQGYGGGGSGGGGDPTGGSPGGKRAGGAGGPGRVVVKYQIGTIAPGAHATGGRISFFSGKVIHTFLSSGTFTNTSPAALDCEVVIVGGGGGGGAMIGGGGGAGGYRVAPTVSVSAGPTNAVTVTVGAGGRGGSGQTPNPNSLYGKGQGGQDSKFGPSYPSGYGGGGGRGWHEEAPYNNSDPAPASTGGVGGGWNTVGTAGNSGTYGNNGGVNSNSAPNYGSGGGGGSGSVGATGQNNDSGDGGAGTQLPVTFRDPMSTVGTWADVSDFNTKYYVAGGGGGGGYPGAGTGGNGKAGGGCPPTQATPHQSPAPLGGNVELRPHGVAGTGGGGAGGSAENPSYGGGNGGDGIVLVAYPQ